MLRGAFGPVHPYHISGWAYDPDDPAHPVEVEVRLDDTALGVATANLPTDDPRAGAGSGRCGFALETRQLLPITEPHRLRVLATGRSGQVVALAHAPPPRPVLRYPLATSDATQHPVFILGAVRSGTTAIMHALAKSTRYIGPGEGHLLDMLAHMFLVIRKTYADRRSIWEMGLDAMITKVPESFLLDSVRHAGVELAQALFPDRYWFDKTPTPAMVAATPILKAIWPEARFIFMQRRAIENILSRQRRFPGESFDHQCRDWTQTMENWELVRDHLGSSAIAIEHLAMARHPEIVAKMVGLLLSLSEPEELSLRQDLATARPERTAENFAALHALDLLPWTTAQIDSFRQICGPTMDRFGYDETEAYFGRATKPP